MNRLVKKIVKKCFTWTVRPVLSLYLLRETRYMHGGLTLRIFPGVFHPAFHLSTAFLVAYIEQMDLVGRRFLEVGAGSGLISLVACRKGARVTATDISRTAVECTRHNAAINELPVDVICGNVFENVPEGFYDVVAINPPYYPRAASTERDLAWYCGTNFEFFRRVFGGLRRHVGAHSVVVMTLSEECDLETIGRLARDENLKLKVIESKRILWEMNFIYQIECS